MRNWVFARGIEIVSGGVAQLCGDSGGVPMCAAKLRRNAAGPGRVNAPATTANWTRYSFVGGLDVMHPLLPAGTRSAALSRAKFA